jgi:hypothetical protein
MPKTSFGYGSAYRVVYGRIDASHIFLIKCYAERKMDPLVETANRQPATD